MKKEKDVKRKLILLISLAALVWILILISGCAEINSFEECVEAGYPVLESYPRQCKTDSKTFVEEITICNSMTLEEAKEIALASECGDRLIEPYICNFNTHTWWIDLDIEKEGCTPACVVDTETKQAEINWRCTGLIE